LGVVDLQPIQERKLRTMEKFAVIFLSLFVSLNSIGKNASSASPLEISLESASESEKIAKSLIDDFVKKYDLTKYFFTHKIHIQSFVIPHSHPILTLNTRTIKEPDRFLALFIHEQIHWFFDLDGRAEKTKIFIEKMRQKFPKVPSQKEGGANDDQSTYLHLGVCYYELDQLSKLIGKEKAEQIFKTDEIYSWVRQQVLVNKNFIRDALNESGLQWQAAGVRR
jgi:hypothetical protein